MKTTKNKDLVEISKDIGDGDRTPLCFYSRARGLAKELLSISDCSRLVDLPPNGCDMRLGLQAALESCHSWHRYA